MGTDHRDRRIFWTLELATLPAGASLALLVQNLDNRQIVYLNGQPLDDRAGTRSEAGMSYSLAPLLHPGANSIAIVSVPFE